MKKVACCSMAALFSCAAIAETYWWIPRNSNAYASFGDGANWTTNAAYLDDDSDAVPGANDAIGMEERKKYCFDLGGENVTVGEFGGSIGGDANASIIKFKNGTFTVNKWWPKSGTHTIESTAKMVIPANGFFWPGCASITDGTTWNPGPFDVYGQLEINESASIAWYAISLNVKPGGTVSIAQGDWYLCYDRGHTGWTIKIDGGTLDLPHGITTKRGYYNGNSGGTEKYVVELNTGTLKLGAPFIDELGKGFNVELKGGTLETTADIDFSRVTSATIANGAAVTFVPAANTTLDLSNATAAGAFSATINGAGKVKCPLEPSALAFGANGGTLEFLGATLNLDGFAAAAPATVQLDVPGVILSGTPASMNNVAWRVGYSFDLLPILVANVADDEARAALIASLTAEYGADNLVFVAEGSAIYAKDPTADVVVFNPSKAESLADPDGWSNGTVATDGKVEIAGTGVAKLDDAALTAGLTDITIDNGATLLVTATSPVSLTLTLRASATVAVGTEASVALTALNLLDDNAALAVSVGKDGVFLSNSATEENYALTLADGASFTVADNTVVTLRSLVSSYETIEGLPSVVCGTGATLSVPSTTVNDIDLTVRGTLTAPDADGNWWFGRAAAGEHRAIGFKMEGADAMLDKVANGHIRIGITEGADAEVAVAGTVTFDNTLEGNSGFTTRAFKGLTLGGEENCTDTAHKFDVLIKNCKWTLNRFAVNGCTVTLDNTKYYHNNYDTWDASVDLTGAGQVILTKGSVLGNNNNSRYRSYKFNTADRTRPAFVVNEGCTFFCADFTAGANGAIQCAGGQVVDKSWGTCQIALFNIPQFELVEGTTTLISYVGWKSDGCVFAVYDSVAFTGSGDLKLKHKNWYNGDGYSIKAVSSTVNSERKGRLIYLKNCNSTATGTLSVENANDGIRFCDGTVWPGTVVCNGNLATEEVSGARGTGFSTVETGPVTVSFGTLQMDGDFTLRLGADWCDRVDVTTGFTAGEGALAIDDKADGAAFANLRNKFIIASIPSGTTVPKVRLPAGLDSRWKVRPVADPEDADRTLLVLSYQSGFTISFR